jgi:hypothetical protein
MNNEIKLKRLSNKKLNIKYELPIIFYDNNDSIIYRDIYSLDGVVEIYKGNLFTKKDNLYELTNKTVNRIRIRISQKYSIQKLFISVKKDMIEHLFENEKIEILTPLDIEIKGHDVLQKVRKIKIDKIWE